MTNNQKSLIIKALQHLAAILFFLFATIIFFSPQFFDGKELPQSDVTQFQGSSQDLRKYYNEEGESSAWTGGMFSGMPAYQIGVWGGSPNFLDYLEAPFRALGGTTAGPVFAGMVMAYILFLILGCSIPMAMFGAMAYSLTSYNIILLDAGHATKAWALAYMPVVVGGLLAMYKNKYIIGGLCMALGLALQIKSNHLQMTYYTAILCAILYISLLTKQIKNKEFTSLWKSSGALAVAVVLALAANAGALYSNYEMSKTSTRGQSELTAQSDDQKTDGLDKNYVFGWSYGKAETLTLLIPNLQGGVSTPFGEGSETIQALSSMMQNRQIDEQGANTVYGMATQYWGDQPFTQGPVYIGVVVCFLFLLGMLIIRNPLKWVLFGSSVFFILLAWGSNFEGFNDLFYYHFPLYSKFRAVSQALVIPTLLAIIVAVWAIKEFLDTDYSDKKKLMKSLYIATGVTGGICLIFWMMPTAFFNFLSARDAAWKDQLPVTFLNAVIADRKSLLTADALRSLIFIVLAAAVLWFSLKNEKMKNIAVYTSLALVILATCDLWGIDKRYLGDNKFVDHVQQTVFKKSAADEIILKDTGNYRVLNLNSPFQDGLTSYYHRSIGGYHAAKLQRYEQLINRRLNPELMNIYESFQTQDIDSITMSMHKNTALNMLNARYMIFDAQQPPLVNPFAMGNAWFVENYRFVENADAEIEALNTLYPEIEAVIDRRYESELSGLNIQADSAAVITLTSYKPNVLTYRAKARSEQLAVFSEVFYANGWNAYIDDKPAPHFCADWILRAMRVPEGEHEIVFKFEPAAYNTSRAVASASSALLILLLMSTVVIYFTRNSKEKL